MGTYYLSQHPFSSGQKILQGKQAGDQSQKNEAGSADLVPHLFLVRL